MPTPTPRLSVAVAFALSVLIPQAASAGPLAPTKPSQVVNIVTGVSLCNGGGYGLDWEVRPDGTTAPFTIPAGQVLVLTGFSWAVGLVSPSELVTVFLIAENAAGWAFSDFAVAAPLGGYAGRWVSVPNVVIKSGQRLCVRSPSGPYSSGQVQGFFAKDK